MRNPKLWLLRQIPPALLLVILLAGCQARHPAERRLPSGTPFLSTAAPAALSTASAAAPAPGAATAGKPLTPTAPPAPMPPMAREAAFAYHYLQGQLVAFGGVNPNPGGCSPCSETWVWGWTQTGKGWVQRLPAHSPPTRSGAAMADDAERMLVVLFGGADGQQAFADTWLWDGEDWTQAHPAAAPSPRFNARMAYDVDHRQVVLWGGMRRDAGQNDPTFLSDTWTWDGKTWTRREAPGPVNGAVAPSGLAYDGNLHRVVMWQPVEGLWAWDGSAWMKAPFTGSPDRLTQGQIGFDETRFYRRLVLRGSTPGAASPSVKTWTLDGKAWALVETSAAEGNLQDDTQMVYTFSHQALLYLTPTGLKSGAPGLNVLAWNRSTWVDAVSYVAPPPPVTFVQNFLDTSNRKDLAICVQVEDPGSKNAQARFRDAVKTLIDTQLSQDENWKKMYGQFAYRVDAGCPTGPHVTTSVDFPSEYKLHVYVVSAGTVKEINGQLAALGMSTNHPVMYEMFAEGWNDSASPVTFALFLTPSQMQNLSYVEQQLSEALVHPVFGSP